MGANEKMAEIINYVCDIVPGIALDKKWNRLIRDMTKELEILEDLAQPATQPARSEAGESDAERAARVNGPNHWERLPEIDND